MVDRDCVSRLWVSNLELWLWFLRLWLWSCKPHVDLPPRIVIVIFVIVIVWLCKPPVGLPPRMRNKSCVDLPPQKEYKWWLWLNTHNTLSKDTVGLLFKCESIIKYWLSDCSLESWRQSNFLKIYKTVLRIWMGWKSQRVYTVHFCNLPSPTSSSPPMVAPWSWS